MALGVIYTGRGAAIATRYASINTFLLPASLVVTLLLLPLLAHVGFAPRSLFFLHPIEPPLTLPLVPLLAISWRSCLAIAAPDKVAGFAIVKVLNSLNLLPVAAFFLPRPLQYVAGIIPAYWPMRALWSAADGEEYAAYLAIGAIAAALALVLAAAVFERKLWRG